jgi:hypothetical protein
MLYLSQLNYMQLFLLVITKKAESYDKEYIHIAIGVHVSVHGYYFMTLTSIRYVHVHIYSFFRSYVRFE